MFIHFILNIKALLFLKLVHFLPCSFFRVYHVFSQFNWSFVISSNLKLITSLILFRSAHVVLYTVAVVMFTNVLNVQSIVLFFQRGVTLIELVVTSYVSSIRLDKSSSFARLSALLFHIFILYSLTLISSSLIIFVLQQSTI